MDFPRVRGRQLTSLAVLVGSTGHARPLACSSSDSGEPYPPGRKGMTFREVSVNSLHSQCVYIVHRNLFNVLVNLSTVALYSSFPWTLL